MGIAEVLGEIGDQRAIDPLIALLDDKQVEVRIKAIDSLGQLGDMRAVSKLRSRYKSKDPAEQRHADKALRALGVDPEQIEGNPISRFFHKLRGDE